MKKAILSLSFILLSSFIIEAQNHYVDEDFNGATAAPAGWTNTAVTGTQAWNFGIDGASATGNQNLDGTEFVHFDDDALGGGSTNNTISLLTPVFDNSASPVTSLEFDYNLRTFNGIADSFYVDVFDGASWIRVFSTQSDDCGNYFGTACAIGIPHANINISAFNNANCQVRFTYHDGNDWGWYAGLDNVEIWSPLPFDLMVSSITRPISGCGLSATDTVEVQISNVGSNPTSNFNVAYTINGGAVNSELVSSTLNAGSTMNYKFAATANLSSIGNYDFDAFTILATDGNNANDTAKLTVQNEPAFSPTYNEDFENANHLWTVSGTNASWQRGFPSGTQINLAASGNRAFVTNLTGPYNNNETSFLTSPCLDFSASVGDPIMTFSMYLLTETNFDRVWMESSIDNGVTWTKILASANPTNWYNNGANQVWTGTRTGWYSVENILTGLGGQSQVKVRFAFTSDGSSTLEGVGIDNFAIRDPQLFDISLNTLEYPVAASAPECGYGIEFITVELENKGANTLNNFDVGFSVDGSTPVIETITTPLASNTVMNYTFMQSYDFTVVKNYNVDVFATATGDSFQPNDSVLNSIVNNTSVGSVPFPHKQDFDSWTAGTQFSNTNDAIGGGWTRNSSANNVYTWRVAPDGNNRSGGTGPDADHTGGNFLYTEASSGGNGDVATLTSPCIDLSSRQGARMSFWYHRFGNNINSPIFIDVYDGAQWNMAHDQVGGASHANATAPFLEKEVDLNIFAGKKIKIQFRAVSGGCCGGDMAIDDITMWEPIPQDASITDARKIGTSSPCVSNPASIQIEITNAGTQPILANTMNVSYKTFNGSPVTELVPTNIPVGGTLNYTFTQQLVSSNNSGSQVVTVWANLPGDSNNDNDRMQFSYYSGGVNLPLYVMDFEGHAPNNLQGWTRSNGTFRWNVIEGEAPAAIPPPGSMLIATGPSGDHTLAGPFENGKGKYMMVETNITPANYAAATLNLPCLPIDFSNSVNRSVALTFWYHIFGPNTADLFVDVYDGTRWQNGIGVVRGQGTIGQRDAQTAATDTWHEAFVNLDQFATPTSNNLQIRFRAEYSKDATNGAPAAGGDIAIDDILIIDRILNDVSTIEFLDLESDCSLNSNEEIKVDVQNIGTQDIIKLNMVYQINFTPSPYGANAANPSTLFPPVEDSAVGILVIPDAKFEFTFDTRVDMTEPGTYDFTIWSSVPGDTNTFNDTLKYRVKNETRPGISCENWSELESGDIPNRFLDETLPNDWAGTDGNYAFKAAIGTTTDGPISGHTGNANDIYMVAVNGDGDPGAIAQIESPCFDLTNTPSANLEFWYWTEGANGVPLLAIDVKPGQNSAWQLGVDSIFPVKPALVNGTNTWTAHRLVMTDYVGDFVNIRFRSFSPPGQAVTPGVYAIDDICLVVPPPQQIELERLLNPRAGLCFYSDSEYVRIRVQNIGSDRIDSFQVVVAVDTTNIQAVKGSSYFRDTAWVVIDKPPFFNAGVKTDYVVDRLPIDMSLKKDYFVSVYLLLQGDLDPLDQFILDKPIVHQVPDTLIYSEDFESLGVNEGGPEYSNRWVRSNGDYPWRLKRGMDVRNQTGPSADHTKGNSTGKYMVTNSAATDAENGDGALLESPCIDLTTAKNPVIRYWYHMFGFDMGFLYLEVNDDSGWETVDSIKVESQFRNQDPWLESDIISLKEFAGKYSKIRFRAIRGNGENSNMAIDDILIYDLAPKDLSPIKLVRPNRRITSCYSDTQSVYVTLRNFGSDSIDFVEDTTDIVVTIFKNNIPHDVMNSKLNYNVWKTPNGIIRPLPQDSTVTVRLDGSFDMSVIGDSYRFEIETFMHNDSGPLNNIHLDTVVNRMEGGKVTLLTTSYEVCKGTGVKVEVSNYFGSLRWEDSLEVANGPGFWQKGFNFPFDSSRYIGYPDTTAWFRVKVCDRVYSDSVKMNVVRVPSPRGVSASRCGPGVLTLGAIAPQNVDSVYVYSGNTVNDTIPYLTLNTLPFQFTESFTETDTFYLGGIIHDSCFSEVRTPVFAVINPFPIIDLGIPLGTVDTICELTDTLAVFSGGAVDGRLFTYNWTITHPGSIGDSITNETSASILFDTRKLSKDLKRPYSVSVVTTSDSGCVTASGTVFFVIDSSCTVGVNENGLAQNLKVYPNPTNGLITIALDTYSGVIADIELQSMDGKTVISKPNSLLRNKEYQMDVGILPDGIYLLKIKVDDGLIIKKIIKN